MAFGESGALQVLEVRKRGCMMSGVRSISGMVFPGKVARSARHRRYNASVTWELIVHGG